MTTQTSANLKRIGMTWPVGTTSGWGVYGLNLSLELLSRQIMPLWFSPAELTGVGSEHQALLAVVQEMQRQLATELTPAAGRQITLDCPVLSGLGNGLMGLQFPFLLKGSCNIGVVFFENSEFSGAAIERGKAFDKIIAGSGWNASVLRAHGLDRVAVVLQGIDPLLFHPGPRSGRWKDRFVIFSGGKLEYRKGQDLVIAAVREFLSRHPDALLTFAWHNAWPRTMREIDRAGHVQGAPETTADGKIDFAGWLRRQGVSSFVDLGLVPNTQMAPLLRETDVALFPNRCEGGTNLVAMECLACGVPTILSANTGHLDIIAETACAALTNQGIVRATESHPSVRSWGESSIPEMVEALEQIYRNREEAGRRAAIAAQAIRKFSWKNQVDRLLMEIAS